MDLIATGLLGVVTNIVPLPECIYEAVDYFDNNHIDLKQHGRK